MDTGKPSIIIRTGPVADRAFRGMGHAIAAMATQGNNLIVDEVLAASGRAAEYAEVLSPFEVFWVEVFTSLDILEMRERQRGDRMIGLVRWQYDRVHKDMTYTSKSIRAAPRRWSAPL